MKNEKMVFYKMKNPASDDVSIIHLQRQSSNQKGRPRRTK